MRLLAGALGAGLLLAALVTFAGGGVHDPNQEIGYDATGAPLHPNPEAGRLWGKCITLQGSAYPDPDAQCKTGPSPEQAAQAEAEEAAGASGVVVLANCYDGGIMAIQATIREREHGPNPGYDIYRKGYNGGGATGAYQYIDSTWANFGGYPSSYLAPRNVQDEKARLGIESALRRGGVEAVPAIWYVGHVPTSEAEWNTVPAPWAGNRLTVRQYANNWMTTYYKHAAACG